MVNKIMIKLITKLSTLIRSQVNNIPRQCLLCNTKVYEFNLCKYCVSALPRLENRCGLCHWPIMANMEKCTLCISEDFCNHDVLSRLVNIHIAMPYAHPIDKMICKFKYNGDLAMGDSLAYLLLRSMQSYHNNVIANKLDLPEVIIPVPLSNPKLKSRGFNQSQEIAKVIAKNLNIKLDTNLVAKYKETLAQKEQDRVNRTKNLANSFCLNYIPKYRSVAIVDDVVTTGSTIAELIHLLNKTNIRKIQVWAIARRV